jgi:hypothetical protein
MNNLDFADYKNYPIENPGKDFDLIYSRSEKELDVAWDGNTIQLRKVGFFERVVNWLRGTNPGRINRLKAYVERVYVQPLGMDSGHEKRFYASLRKWTQVKVDFSKLSTPILERLSSHLVSVREALHSIQAQMKEFDGEMEPKERDKAISSLNQYTWKERRAETELAEELGIGPIGASGGVNGAKFGLGLDGKILTVFKENGEDHRLFNERLLFQRTQPQVCDNDPRTAGAVAYMASEYFGFSIVPTTMTDGGVSVQLFLKKTVAADEATLEGYKLKNKPAEKFTDAEIELLQMKAIFNYFTGDLDGKDDKLRLKIDASGRILEIFETDNDNTFPANSLEKSKDGRTLTKTHAWKRHKWAKKQLDPQRTSKLHNILEKLFSPKQLSSFICNVEDNYPGFFSSERIQQMQERLAVLKMAYQCKLPISELGEIYSAEYLEQHKNPNAAGYLNVIEDYKPLLVSPMEPVPAPSTNPVGSTIKKIFSLIARFPFFMINSIKV